MRHPIASLNVESFVLILSISEHQSSEGEHKTSQVIYGKSQLIFFLSSPPFSIHPCISTLPFSLERLITFPEQLLQILMEKKTTKHETSRQWLKQKTSTIT